MNLLNEILLFRLRPDHLIMKNRHERTTTGRPIDDNFLVTPPTQKTTGPLQHLRLRIRSARTLQQALHIVYAYTKYNLSTFFRRRNVPYT